MHWLETGHCDAIDAEWAPRRLMRFWDGAIEVCLTLKVVFGLALRQRHWRSRQRAKPLQCALPGLVVSSLYEGGVDDLRKARAASGPARLDVVQVARQWLLPCGEANQTGIAPKADSYVMDEIAPKIEPFDAANGEGVSDTRTKAPTALACSKPRRRSLVSSSSAGMTTSGSDTGQIGDIGTILATGGGCVAPLGQALDDVANKGVISAGI